MRYSLSFIHSQIIVHQAETSKVTLDNKGEAFAFLMLTTS